MVSEAAWRVLRTWDGEPGWNMALDEALLESADPRPTLRFYTWSPGAVSLGYFQRWKEVAALAGAEALVRRFTGGGAIHHADELTYSIAAPLEHPLFRGAVRGSYERVHALLAQAFAELGLRAAAPRGSARVASDRDDSGMCFHRSTDFDLCWDRAKGVGSAQRRAAGRVLHHGSIKLGATPLEEGVATLRAHLPDVEAGILARKIQEVFERALEAGFEPAEPSPAESAHAARRAGFYASDEFVRRR